jgi:hypothetical protein
MLHGNPPPVRRWSASCRPSAGVVQPPSRLMLTLVMVTASAVLLTVAETGHQAASGILASSSSSSVITEASCMSNARTSVTSQS